MSRMKGWDVYRNIDTPNTHFIPGEYMTTVYFDADMTEKDVRRSLVSHDGYSPSILLRRGSL